METTVVNVVRDGDNLIVHARFRFPAADFSADEVTQIVKGFQAPDQTLAAVQISPLQAQINKQMGVSDMVFAKYNPTPR